MRTCHYRGCDQDLDQLPVPPKASAKYCCDAHKVAEHRAKKEAPLERAEATFWSGVGSIVRRRPGGRATP